MNNITTHSSGLERTLHTWQFISQAIRARDATCISRAEEEPIQERRYRVNHSIYGTIPSATSHHKFQKEIRFLGESQTPLLGGVPGIFDQERFYQYQKRCSPGAHPQCLPSLRQDANLKTLKRGSTPKTCNLTKIATDGIKRNGKKSPKN